MEADGYYKILNGKPKITKKIYNFDNDIKSFKNFRNLKLDNNTNSF